MVKSRELIRTAREQYEKRKTYPTLRDNFESCNNNQPITKECRHIDKPTSPLTDILMAQPTNHRQNGKLYNKVTHKNA